MTDLVDRAWGCKNRQGKQSSATSCYVGIPVICQNGHKAIWLIKIAGISPEIIGVPEWMKCSCPKFKFGQVYRQNGPPVTIARVKSWQQDTNESGHWVETHPLPINNAVELSKTLERGQLVYT